MLKNFSNIFYFRRTVVKMRRLCVAGLVTLLTISTVVVAADEQAVKFGVSADYYSKYIWRGQVLDNKSVFQPAVSASAYGFTGSLWGNMELSDHSKIVPDNAGEFSEFDWGLDYTNTMPDANWLSYSAGVLYYRFPNQPFDPTTEVYGGLTLSTCPLSPSFKWYRDVDVIKGSYFQFSIGQTVDKIYSINEKCYCSLALGASYGWGNTPYDKGYFGVPAGQSNDLTLTVGLPVCIDSWTVKPSVNYATMLSDSIRRATDDSENFWWGIGLSTSF
jgi:hypothetical protein